MPARPVHRVPSNPSQAARSALVQRLRYDFSKPFAHLGKIPIYRGPNGEMLLFIANSNAVEIYKDILRFKLNGNHFPFLVKNEHATQEIQHLVLIHPSNKETFSSSINYASLNELIKDRPLYQRGKRPLFLDDVLEIVKQVASGIETAAAAGYILRTSSEKVIAKEQTMRNGQYHLSPSEWKVFLHDLNDAESLRGNGRAKEVNGSTLYHLSPEEMRGERATAKSEMYRLGLLFYELLTERHPFEVIMEEYENYNGLIKRSRSSEGLTPEEIERLEHLDLPHLPPDPEIWDNMSIKEKGLHLAKELEKRLLWNRDGELEYRLLNLSKGMQGLVRSLLLRLLRFEPEAEGNDTGRDGTGNEYDFIGAVNIVLKLFHDEIARGPENRTIMIDKKSFEELAEGGTAKVKKFTAFVADLGLRRFEFVLKEPLVSDHPALAEINENNRYCIRNERNILQAVKSSEVVNLVEERTLHDKDGRFELPPDSFVLPFMPGGTLKDKIAPIKDVWGLLQMLNNYLIKTAEALKSEIHDMGVVHRDIKPENIFLDSKGRAKFADFGVSRRAGDRITLSGTPEYAPPEQLDFHPFRADPKSDVYALGITFFKLITGIKENIIKAPNERGIRAIVAYARQQKEDGTVADKITLKIAEAVERLSLEIEEEGQKHRIIRDLTKIIMGMTKPDANERWSINKTIRKIKAFRRWLHSVYDDHSEET